MWFLSRRRRHPYLPERIIGKTSQDLDANEAIWNFFRKHTMN